MVADFAMATWVKMKSALASSAEVPYRRNGLTIGTKLLAYGSESGAPILRDNVELGAACVLIGEIEISSHCVIGAGAVVTKSVPEGGIAVGNPFRLLGTLHKGTDR